MVKSEEKMILTAFNKGTTNANMESYKKSMNKHIISIDTRISMYEKVMRSATFNSK